MITRISTCIGNYIASHAEKLSQNESITYGIEIMIRSLIKFAAISLVSLYFDTFYETMVLVVFSALLRSFSGGIHCSSYTRCLITSTILFSLLGMLVKFLEPLITAQAVLTMVTSATFFLLIICILWIPTGNEERPLTTYYEKKRFKFLSFSIITTHFVICIPILLFYPNAKVFSFILASTAGLLWQGFTVTPLGCYFINQVDFLLKLKKGGLGHAEKI